MSPWVILKSPNNITPSYVSNYMEKLSDEISKSTDLLWSGGSFKPTINHFLKRRFISRKRVSLSSLWEFSCFTGILSLTYMDRPPLSCLNILLPDKRN